MLTLITGTPGSFKTAYTVWEIARLVPGSTVEAQERVPSHGKVYEAGEAVPRHLFCNINGLLVDHEVIDPEAMARWPKWVQPGDHLIYDEVQTIWRPRAVGSKVPEEIQALETHRHMGIDITVVTQHPMLLDSNVRRLVNRHLHLRRVAGGFCIVYEWDHCGQPGAYKTCVGQTMWRAKRDGFKLYKSAQLHTKPTQSVPKVALIGVAALAGAAYLAPMAYGRITDRFKAAEPAKHAQAASAPVKGGIAPAHVPASAPAPAQPAPQAVPAAPRYVGCMVLGPRCECFTPEGTRADLEPQACREGVERLASVIPLDMGAGSGGGSVAGDLAAKIARTGAAPGAPASAAPADGGFNLPPLPFTPPVAWSPAHPVLISPPRSGG